MIHQVFQHVFYAKPDQYPPIVNSVRLLADTDYHTDLFCCLAAETCAIAFLAEANILRIGNKGAGSWQEYLTFAREVVRKGSGDAGLFVGHDMHGFVPAWLLSRRYRRPLAYHCHDFAESVRGRSVRKMV